MSMNETLSGTIVAERCKFAYMEMRWVCVYEEDKIKVLP